MTESEPFQRVDIGRAASPDGLREITVLSPSLGRRADVTLFAPHGHEAAESLPVVVLLHGVHGSHWSWARNGLAHLTLNELVKAGRIRPMILAMPSDGLFGVGSGYFPHPDEDAETWIVTEVAQATRLVFPRADTADVSIAGLSMGGWGALRLAGLYPHRFRAAVGMSPLTRVAHTAGYAPENIRRHHEPDVPFPVLGDLLESVGSDLPPLRITCGVDDDLIDDVRLLHRDLTSAQVTHQYAENPGGHDWEYWAEDLRTTLLFIDSARAGTGAPPDTAAK